MTENGVISKLLDQYIPKNLCANDDKIKGGQTATLSDVYGAVVFLSLGLSFGLIVFTIEIYLKTNGSSLLKLFSINKQEYLRSVEDRNKNTYNLIL